MKRLVAFGHRHAGAPKRGEAIGRLELALKNAGLETSRDDFSSPDPRDARPWPMTNLVGRLRPEASCRVLLGSHFDTRHVAEQDPDPSRRGRPIEGANDGTSGVAVLLALAPRLGALLPAGVGADVVLFDGEEMGYPDTGGYCAGSRRYAASMPSAGRPRLGVILDMVCSPKATFRVDPSSRRAHPALVESLWAAGRSLDPAAFSLEEGPPLTDDHTPLSQAGVPSALLIGYDDPNWHTAADALPGCSRKRLERVEAALAEFLSKRLGPLLPGCGEPPPPPAATSSGSRGLP